MEESPSRYLPLTTDLFMHAMQMEQNAITFSFLMELSSQSPTYAGHSGEGVWRGTKPAD